MYPPPPVFVKMLFHLLWSFIPLTLLEAGMPSAEWAKRKKQTLKIGHGGTLDSAARGVLGKRCEWKFNITVT